MEKIQIKSVNLTGLSSLSEIIKITLSNSPDIVEEICGEEDFSITLNTKNNNAINPSKDSDLSLSKQFLAAENVGIYGPYTELKSWPGPYTVSGDNWVFELCSNTIEWIEGDLDENDAKLISDVLTSDAVYSIVNEVLKEIRIL
jgi:hypothetical protein